MMGKTALLVLVAVSASVALADDLDDLIALEDQAKTQFDHLLNLRKIENILDGVSSACLEHRCFQAGDLYAEIDATFTGEKDCGQSVKVELGGVNDFNVVADAKEQRLGGCMFIGAPSGCPCQRELTRLAIRKVANCPTETSVTIKSLKLLWKTNDGSFHTIFADEPSSAILIESKDWLHYDLDEIKNSDAFMSAKAGSCQN